MAQRQCVSWDTGSRTPFATASLSKRIPNGILLFATVLLTCLSPATVHSQEPAKEFVEALRANGYYDLAIQYLDDLEKGTLVDNRFRKQLPLEKAETLIQSVNKIRDLEKWESRLNEAQSLLTDYASKVTDPESIATSQQYQANLSYRQARVYLKRSESDRLTASEKETQLASARERMEKALNGYLQAQETVKNFLSSFQIDPNNVAESTQMRDDMRKMYVGIRLKAPIVREALADTYTEEAKKKEQLAKAAEEFSELWDKYYNFPQGLDACLYAARTNYKLKKYKEALVFTSEIFGLSDVSAFRIIKRKGAVVATDCWKNLDPYPVNEIIDALEEPIAKLNRNEKVHPEWLQVQLELAKAYRARADEVKAAKGKPSEVSRWNKLAAFLARTVSRSPSPVREDARTLLTEWKIDVSDRGSEDKEIATFLDARDKARELASELETSLIEVSQVKAGWKRETDPGKKSELEMNLNSAREELRGLADTTLSMLQRALVLADDSIDREELNLVRYLQCFSYYASERYFESGIIGEFMLARYPSVGWTQQASGLVVKSYSRLYDAANSPKEKAFESNRLNLVGTRIIDRWPGSNEAINAAEKLANIALINKDYVTAEKHLSTIPSGHPSRISLSLRVGASIWDQYGRDNPRDPQKLQTAITLLTEGLESSRIETLSFTAALASMRLVRAHLANKDVAQAMERLEKAKIAPIDLLKQKHPTIINSQFAQTYTKETYKTAVNTYLAALKDGSFDEEELTNKCLGSLQGLKQILESGGEAGQKQLVDTYKLVAARFSDIFENIEEPARKTRMATNIGKLLGTLEKGASDGRTIFWAGETIFKIAEQIQDSDATTARTLFNQADVTFARAGSVGFTGDRQEAILKLELGRMQALAKRGFGQYEAAVKALEEVLKARPGYLQAQLDAAETLYQWGKAESLTKAYAEAMGGRGRYRDDKGKQKKLIWGWQQMIKLTMRDKEMRNTYLRVQLGQTQTMLEYGLLSKNAKAFKSVKRDMENFKTRFPDLGGERWRAKFEALDQRIQREAK